MKKITRNFHCSNHDVQVLGAQYGPCLSTLDQGNRAFLREKSSV